MYTGIREALDVNRTLFVKWRYLHELHGAWAETSALKEAISAIIGTFEEPALFPKLTILPDRRGC